MRSAIVLAFLLVLNVCGQQTLKVTPAEFDLQMVQGGPLPGALTMTVTSSGDWTAALGSGPGDMLGLANTSGATGGTITANLTDWWAVGRPAGSSDEQTIVVSLKDAPAVQQTVRVKLSVVAALPGPTFSYLGGPNGCQEEDGYPDAALCDVPGEKPAGNFTPPGPGGIYPDPTFGAPVRILTPVRAIHGYSTPSAISAGNRYVLVSQDGTTRILDFRTGRKVRDKDDLPFEGTVWDAVREDVLYFVSDTSIRSYNVSSNKMETVVDYSKAPYRFSKISTGGTGDTSKDNWMAFFAAEQQQICALKIDAKETFCASYANIVPAQVSVDFVLMTKGIDQESGKRYVLLMSSPVMMSFVVNESAGRLDFSNLGGETQTSSGNRDGACDPGEPCLANPHADTMEDARGVQYLVLGMESSVPCEYDVVAFQLNRTKYPGKPVELGGGFRRAMRLYRCGGKDVWADIHLGCAKLAPSCAVSTGYGAFTRQFPADMKQPIQQTAHLAEILVIRNFEEIRRLAKHRSVPLNTEPDQSYWTTPRACLSPDGTYVVADSNFGESNRHRVISIETGLGKTRIADNGVVNAASLDNMIAPQSMVSIFGQNLTNCYTSASSFPVPDSVCNTTVEFGGKRARILFAIPSQLNVITPADVPAGAAVDVTVTRGSTPDDKATESLGAGVFNETAPSLFTYQLDDGLPRAVIQNEDYSFNGPTEFVSIARPLRIGESGIIYANGLGPTDPAVPVGTAAPTEPLARTTLKTTVLVNERPQPVTYSGLLPTFANLYQVNFLLEPGTEIRGVNENRIQLEVGGRRSASLVVSIAP